MSTHESRVNYQKLIRDLAEMYPYDVSEVVVVELIANSLDARATRITIDYDPRKQILVISDNGQGMNSEQFTEYHDFAAALKKRGMGIGFAGLGAKISFNIADRVITETKSKTFSGGSNWFLESNKKLVWADFKPTHLKGNGTRVEVHFGIGIKPVYFSSEDLIKILHYHYLPLIDKKFLSLYDKLELYSKELRFMINGQMLELIEVKKDFSLDKVREFFPKKAGKNFGYGILGLSSKDYPISSNISGILLCTNGKVIKPDLFNQFPGMLGPRIFGIVEIPELINFLTTSKTDFIRTAKHREFEKLYDPIRQEFKDWLRELGIETPEITSRDEALKLERELKKIIEDVPELSEFFGFRAHKSVLKQSEDGQNAEMQEGIEKTFPEGEGSSTKQPGPLDIGEEPGESPIQKEDGAKKVKPISRIAKRGPKITFFEAPEKVDIAWVDGNSIIINAGHSSYKKASSNNLARRFHNMFAVANAIQKFLSTERDTPDLSFIDRMMSAWGSK